MEWKNYNKTPTEEAVILLKKFHLKINTVYCKNNHSYFKEIRLL